MKANLAAICMALIVASCAGDSAQTTTGAPATAITTPKEVSKPKPYPLEICLVSNEDLDEMVKKDIEGNRKSVGYTYGAGADFDLPGGDYVAVVSLGAVKVEVPFVAKVGERVDLVALLNAGVAAFTTPGGEYMEVLSVAKDINGNRTSFGYSYGPNWQTTLAAGDYLLVVGTDSAAGQSETPFSVKAGERVEVSAAAP